VDPARSPGTGDDFVPIDDAVVAGVVAVVADWWIYAVPPLAGGAIGYFTNDLAIKMLFRPYRPIHVGQFRLPFTPGLIPRNQERLAKRISNTITESLLTPTELEQIARRLLDLDRVQGAIRWLLALTLEQMQGDRQSKTAHILAGVLHDLVGESLPRLLKVWARSEDFLKDQLNRLFDRVLLDYRLTRSQARQISQWLLDGIFAPNRLRLGLVDFLTDDNIRIIDDSFRERTSGTYWVVANLFGVRNSLVRLRNFCLEEPGAANQQFAELLEQLQARDRLYNWLRDISLQKLPTSTVRTLRRALRESLRTYLQTRGASVLQEVSDSVDWEQVAMNLLGRIQSSVAVRNSLDSVSYELALVLDRYLERDLEKIVARVLPILDLDRVIVGRVMATSPENLERAIEGIVKSELQAIVNLGGVLGLAIGLMQSVTLLFR